MTPALTDSAAPPAPPPASEAPRLDWDAVVGARRARFGSVFDNVRRLGAAAGGLAAFDVQGRPQLLIATPALVREVLITRADEFPVRLPGASPGGPLPMLQSDGAAHHARRKAVAPAFRPRHFAAYAAAVAGGTEHLQSGWRDGGLVRAGREMERLALNVIGSTLLGRDGLGDAGPLGQAQRAVNRGGDLKASPARLPLPDPAGRVRAAFAHASLLQAVRDLVQTRRAGGAAGAGLVPDGADMVSVLLQAHDSGGVPGPEADEDFVIQILGVLYAGTVNVAKSLAWACYQLARSPEIAARVREEADALDGPPGFDDLPALGYTLQVYREALRDMPRVGPIQRWAAADLDLGGHRVRRGTRLCVFPYLLHHDPALFPDPARFDPARFGPGWEQTQPRHAFLPFGDGAHACIGNHFTLMLGQIALAVLARRVTFALPPDHGHAPDLLSTLRPRHDLRLRVRRR